MYDGRWYVYYYILQQASASRFKTGNFELDEKETKGILEGAEIAIVITP